MSDSSFRGIKSIQQVKAKMAVLVDFYARFKPDVKELACSRTDYDLIDRWPRAASVEGFAVTDNGIFYRGLRLIYDTGEARYHKPEPPKQDEIT